MSNSSISLQGPSVIDSYIAIQSYVSSNKSHSPNSKLACLHDNMAGMKLLYDSDDDKDEANRGQCDSRGIPPNDPDWQVAVYLTAKHVMKPGRRPALSEEDVRHWKPVEVEAKGKGSTGEWGGNKGKAGKADDKGKGIGVGMQCGEKGKSICDGKGNGKRGNRKSETSVFHRRGDATYIATSSGEDDSISRS